MPGVRLAVISYTPYEITKDLYLDKLTVEEAPPAVTLGAPVPYLKSIGLSWSAFPAESGFARYEVYRRESAGVTIADTRVAVFTDRAATAFTDTGLSIGKSYYYKVFAVDVNDTYVASNEAQSTTVPIALPFADALDDASQWDTRGAWGVETNEAETMLSDSPGTQYGANLNGGNNYALTAVNLTGAVWPVLRFRDRPAFYAGEAGDRGVLEVSQDGANWTRVYGVTGARGTWAEQAVDLSRWRGKANLRIRFAVETNGGLAGDGWRIDDVSVTEYTPPAMQALPFAERFEGGLTNWISGGWTAATNAAYEGASCARDLPLPWTPGGVDAWMALGRELDLSGASPQITLWMRRTPVDGYYAQVYVRISKDGGVNWLDLFGNMGVGQSWARYQCAVPAEYRVPGVRLAVISYTPYEITKDLYLDKLTVEEAPPAVTLATPTHVTVSGMTLNWSAYTGNVFKCYTIYRYTAQGVNEKHTLLATITDPDVISFTDTQLAARTRYYYKVYVYDTNDTGTASNEASAETLGVPLGWLDRFDSGVSSAWTFTGSWGLQAGAGVNGTAGLTDSPGDYANGMDTWAQTAVDLSTAVWPLLVFKDRYALPPSGDTAYVQIGAADNNNIASIAWTTVYTARGNRVDWREQQIDLSQWKDRHTVYIRFRLGADGGVVNDGWSIDDVTVREHVPISQATGVFERFENGLTNWINGGWLISTNTPYEGCAGVRNHDSQPVPAGTDSWLVYGGEFDLSRGVNPKITFWARRDYTDGYYARVYVRISKNGGMTWLDLSGNIPVGTAWTRFQYAVPSEYRTNGVRVAVQSYNPYDYECRLLIDAFGVGAETPGEPMLLTPGPSASVSEQRPLLTVMNAVDSQADALTYSFEVYTNAVLSSTALVAQNPAIASGSGTTSWEVDSDLADGRQYWWRCRATDNSGNTGPWSATGTFFVVIVNTPPTAPLIISPYSDASLPDANGYFIWFASSDPDIGDTVERYHLELALDSTFTHVVIQTEVSAQPSLVLVPLAALTNAAALAINTRYYWRIRAVDQWNAVSDWSTNAFVYGVLQVQPPVPPEPVTVGTATLHHGQLSLTWSETPYPVRIEFSPQLINPQWTAVEGASNLTGTSFTVDLPVGVLSGFYRVVIITE